MKDVQEFIDYCLTFYSDKEGLYPMGATPYEILIALGVRLERHKDVEFDGDTLDREWIRDIMIELRMK